MMCSRKDTLTSGSLWFFPTTCCSHCNDCASKTEQRKGSTTDLFSPPMNPLTKAQLLNQVNTRKMEALILPQENRCSMFRRTLSPLPAFTSIRHVSTRPVSVQGKAQGRGFSRTVRRCAGLRGLRASSLAIHPESSPLRKLSCLRVPKRSKPHTQSFINFTEFFQKGPNL